jgi:hypothetical protein
MPKTDNVVMFYKIKPLRYTLVSDGNNTYFVEVGMEAEFQAFIDSLYEGTGYEGHDYSKNIVEIKHYTRQDSRFTFVDPRIG